MKCKSLPSVEYLNECFEYRDGHLIWRHRPIHHFRTSQGWKLCNTRYSGKIAGYICQTDKGDRYIIGIDKIQYARSRIIFAMLRYVPNGLVDHIDGNTMNDSIDNLREATRQQNAMNAKLSCDSKTKYKGVSYHRRENRFMAKIGIDGKRIFLGYFDDPQLAHKAYCDAAHKHFGEFAREK